MSLLKLVNQINTENFNEKQKEEIFNRKQALGKMGNFAKKAALASLPLGGIAAMSSTPAVAQASDTGNTVKILNYALTAEFLERSFYKQATNSGVIPSSDEPIFDRIYKHEKAHVAFLQSVLDQIGASAVSYKDSDFDFTAGGSLHPFDASQDSSYAQLTILSQAFEDTGVRAYKGQAPRIDRSTDNGKKYLTAALQIHSVEARHAARIRKIRYGMTEGGLNTVPWITGAGANSPDLIKPIYAGDGTFPADDNTTQAGVDVTSLMAQDGSSVSAKFAAQAWDEPLGMAYVVNNILGPNGFGFIPNPKPLPTS